MSYSLLWPPGSPYGLLMRRIACLNADHSGYSERLAEAFHLGLDSPSGIVYCAKGNGHLADLWDTVERDLVRLPLSGTAREIVDYLHEEANPWRAACETCGAKGCELTDNPALGLLECGECRRARYPQPVMG